MKKEKMVTRTMTSTTAIGMVINTTTNEVCELSHTFPGKLSMAQAMTALKPLVNSGWVLAYISTLDYTEALYGVPESVFLSIATILPPRGTTSED